MDEYRNSRTAYKLFRVRKDGSLGSLFIDCRRVIPIQKTLHARRNKYKKGYFYRPYWHSCDQAYAPHLSMKNRQWYVVRIEGYHIMKRPKSQGGKWYLSEKLRVLYPLFAPGQQRRLYQNLQPWC